MKRFFLMVIIVGLMVPAGAYAQKVYKSGSKVILDLTEGAGMPAGAVTGVSKTEIYENFTPQQGVFGTDNGHNGSINEQVFQKLEVAPKDMDATGEIGGTGTRTMQWVPAFNGCKNLTYDNGGWRLPTQRELMLICIFRTALKEIFKDSAISGTDFSSEYYWSSTESSTTHSWLMHSSVGYTTTSLKTNLGTARCVREVTD